VITLHWANAEEDERSSIGVVFFGIHSRMGGWVHQFEPDVVGRPVLIRSKNKY
jgi:hypothetical protein